MSGDPIRKHEDIFEAFLFLLAVGGAALGFLFLCWAFAQILPPWPV